MGGGGDARKCEGCGSSGGKKRKLLECSGCAASFYCSTSCQRNAWPFHKKLCRKRPRAAIAIQSAWRGWSARRTQNLVKVPGETDGEICEVCGKPAEEGRQLDVCDGCKLSLFCSQACQRRGWKGHKAVCRQRQRAAVQIQDNWRRALARMRQIRQCTAATAIQSVSRGWSARRTGKLATLRRVETCDVCGEPAQEGRRLGACDDCKLSLFVCSKACKKKSRKKHKRNMCLQRQRASVKIQDAWRLALARRRRRQRAATKIQTAWKEQRDHDDFIFYLLMVTSGVSLYQFFGVVSRWRTAHTVSPIADFVMGAACSALICLKAAMGFLNILVLCVLWNVFNLTGASILFWAICIIFWAAPVEAIFQRRHRLKRASIRYLGTRFPGGFHSVPIGIFLYISFRKLGKRPFADVVSWFAFAFCLLALEWLHSRGGVISSLAGGASGLCIDYVRALLFYVVYWTGYLYSCARSIWYIFLAREARGR